MCGKTEYGPVVSNNIIGRLLMNAQLIARNSIDVKRNIYIIILLLYYTVENPQDSPAVIFCVN